MPVTKKIMLGTLAFLFAGSIASGTPAHSQVTKDQMQTLVPGEEDLQGFLRVNPEGASPTAPVEDTVSLSLSAAKWSPGWAELPGSTATFSRIRRNMRSIDGTYDIGIGLIVCDTPQTAQEELKSFLPQINLTQRSGALTSASTVGDESWAAASNDRFHTLLFRFGSLIAMIQGSRARSADPTLEFPPAAVEAVACQILLRASQQAKLTGGNAQNTRLAVNGHALTQNALLVGKQTYVPVREFAKAMGLTSGWDTKTGALTLTGAGHKPVALTAGSTAATVGGAKAAALTVPVLKDGGEPVMALSDLLTLTGGRVTGRAGNTVQVKG